MKARFLKILILSWAVLAGCSSKEITKLLEIRGPVLVDEIPEKNFESFEDARAEVISSKQDSGTFRIKFLGSELCKMQNLGLWLGKTYDADQIWLCSCPLMIDLTCQKKATSRSLSPMLLDLLASASGA